MALAAVLACQKTDRAAEGAGLLLSINDGTELVATRATGTAAALLENESKINSVQVFVFNADGTIDNCKRYTDGVTAPGRWTMPAPLKCVSGSKDVWVLVNVPTDYTVSGVLAKSDLLAKTFTMGDMTPTSLIMTGHRDGEVFPADAPLALTMTVERVVCAVSLVKVYNRMMNASYRSSVVINGAFLMQAPGIQNVEGTILASSDASPYSSWYGHHAKETGNALFTDAITAYTIPYWNSNPSTCYSEIHTFYCMPSDIGYAAGSDPSARVLNDGTDIKSSTYLDAEISVNGRAYYYPIVLPKLERNKKYNVVLNVEHIGSNNPWSVVSFTDFTPSITVTNWTEVSLSETI